jgi:hypothetical protein
MYQGQRSDRGYLTRHETAYQHHYNPAVDLIGDAGVCLGWVEGREEISKKWKPIPVPPGRRLVLTSYFSSSLS